MSLMSRSGTVIAAIALAAGSLMTGATTAQADTQWRQASALGPACTELSNGRLCASVIDANHDIQVQYVKDSGSRIRARLGYSLAGTNHWGSWFNLSAGQSKTRVWNEAYPSGCPRFIGLLQVEGQQTFRTPPASCN